VGYAGDYLSYFTTPAEYEQQAYEGGFTLYGHYSSLVLRDTLVGLAKDLVTNQPAPASYPYDPNDGVHLSDVAYGTGAASATATAQPGTAIHLGHTAFSWDGGANGIDRPVDRAYVTIQRLAGRRWSRVTDDLGMEILWSSDSNGQYLARWEVPLSATPGRYRFLITAKRYTLASQPFSVATGAILTPTVSGHTVRLAYPQPYLLNDWTYRPQTASGGSVTFLVDGHRRIVRASTAAAFPIPPGARVSIPARGARDRYGNTNPRAIRIR
jgi:hypothetical protein